MRAVSLTLKLLGYASGALGGLPLFSVGATIGASGFNFVPWDVVARSVAYLLVGGALFVVGSVVDNRRKKPSAPASGPDAVAAIPATRAPILEVEPDPRGRWEQSSRTDQEVGVLTVTQYCPNCRRPRTAAEIFCHGCGSRLVADAPQLATREAPRGPAEQVAYAVPAPGVVQAAFPYGGFWIRVVASIIDSIVFLTLAFIATFAVFGYGLLVQESPATSGSLVQLIIAAIWLAYYTGCTPIWGATPGKLALGYHIVGQDGRHIGYWRSLTRELAKFLSLLGIYLGFIWVGVDARKQGWHDKIAGTYVVGREFVNRIAQLGSSKEIGPIHREPGKAVRYLVPASRRTQQASISPPDALAGVTSASRGTAPDAAGACLETAGQISSLVHMPPANPAATGGPPQQPVAPRSVLGAATRSLLQVVLFAVGALLVIAVWVVVRPSVVGPTPSANTQATATARPNPSPTAPAVIAPPVTMEPNWRVEENKSSGVSMALPASWQMIVDSDSIDQIIRESGSQNPQWVQYLHQLRPADYLFLAVDSLPQGKEGFYRNVVVGRISIRPGDTLDSYVPGALRALQQAPGFIPPLTDARLALPAGAAEQLRFKVRANNAAGQAFVAAGLQYYLILGDKGYVASFATVDSDAAAADDIFDKMIASLRFVK